MVRRRRISALVALSVAVAAAALGLPSPAEAASGLDGSMVSVVGGGAAGADGPGAGAVELKNPQGVAADGYGNIYIADTANCAVRMVDRYGMSSIVAGVKDGCDTTTDKVATDDGTRIGRPTGIAVAESSQLVFVSSNVCIAWRVDLTKPVGATGRVARVAGKLPVGSVAQCGRAANGVVAKDALLMDPVAVAWGKHSVSQGNTFYIAEANGCDVRRVALNSVTGAWMMDVYAGVWPSGATSPTCLAPGTTNPPAGTRTQIPYGQLGGIDTDHVGNVYVSDTNLHIIRRLEPAGAVTTVAGVAGQQGMLDGNGFGRLAWPKAIAVDNNRSATPSIFVADSGNCRVRKVTQSPTAISSVAGNGTCTGTIPAIVGQGAGNLNRPWGIDVTPEGDILVAEHTGHRIRRMYRDASTDPNGPRWVPNTGMNEQFRQFGNSGPETADWTGADATFSVKLGDGRIVWLFGDSYTGAVDPVTLARQGGTMLGNSVAVQESLTGTAAPTIRHVQVKTGTASPSCTAFPKPAGCPLYWPSAGIEVAAKRVQVLMRCVGGDTDDPTQDPDDIGNPIRVDLWELTESATGEWTSTRVKDVPAAYRGPTGWSPCDDRIDFGHAIVKGAAETIGGRLVKPLYVYGKEGGCVTGYAHVARVVPPAGRTDAELGDAWEFAVPGENGTVSYLSSPSGYTRLQDTSRAGQADPALINAGAEYSVTARNGTYRLVTSDLALGAVLAFTAPKPWGPWTPAGSNPSHPAAVYLPPEHSKPILNGTTQTAGCMLQPYGAKEHPALGEGDRYVFSYNVKPMPRTTTSSCPLEVAEHAHVDNYRPRFVDIRQP